VAPQLQRARQTRGQLQDSCVSLRRKGLVIGVLLAFAAQAFAAHPTGEFRLTAAGNWNGAHYVGGGGSVTGNPHAISWGGSHMEVFWAGTDGGLWHSYLANSQWTSPAEISGTAHLLASDPYPISWSAWSQEVFWRGTNGHLWHAWYGPSGWSGPADFGFTVESDPQPLSLGWGATDVFWRGGDQNLIFTWYANGNWHSPVDLGDGPLESSPHPVDLGGGNVDVVWRGSDNNLWMVSPTSGWNNPVFLGDGPLPADADPVTVSAGANHADVLWRGTDNGLWEAAYSSAGGWGHPTYLGAAGNVTGNPIAVRSLLGNIEVAFNGANQDLWVTTFADGWSGVSDIGDGGFTSQPSIASGGEGESEVFWRGTDNGVWHDWTNDQIVAHYIAMPAVRQEMPLDCEAAALQAALAARGSDVSQQWGMNQFGSDLRAAQVSNGNVVSWGNAWVTFVGNVFGAERNFTGYGVYWPPLQRAALSLGHYAEGGQNWSAHGIYLHVSEGHPVVIWIDNSYSNLALRFWSAWDGASVPYTTEEHAVVLSGIDPSAGTVQLLDVASGSFKTFSMSSFENFWSTYSNMAVVID
jgi:uncharacterized protein YvpB